jgi:Protein of unknown function (DUF3313)
MKILRDLRTPLAKLLAALIVVMAGGCTTGPPEIDTSASAVTFDGLYPVKNTRADEAWARAGFDFTPYDKVILEDAGIEYRPGGETGRTAMERSRGGPYEVTEDQKARLESVLMQAFHQELGGSQVFEVVNEPGPDVLLVRGSILDVVSYVPPDETAGRSEVHLRSVGEATLVVELRDSVTNAILARAVDRRAAENAGANLFESNQVSNASEVRSLAQHWASLLRTRLEDLMTRPLE